MTPPPPPPAIPAGGILPEDNPVLRLSKKEQDRLARRGRSLMAAIFEAGLPWYQATAMCAGCYEGEQQEWLLDVRFLKTHNKKTPGRPSSSQRPAAVEV